MRSSKKCPKCSSSEIFSNDKQPNMGERVFLPISTQNSFRVDVYICLNCGYFEEYISEIDLQNAKLVEATKANWRKVI